jgi:hypothetical protein
MDWIAVGAIAELIGALAVVLTLFYLADQVRNNTRMARGAATSEAVAAIRDATTFFVNDASMNELFRKGIVNLGELSEEELGQFHPLTLNIFKACEQLHYQWAIGAMDHDLWAGWEWQLTRYLTSPGNQEWFAPRRLAFSSRFQKWLDNLAPVTELPVMGR